MNLKIAQVIGLNTDQKAAQVLSSQQEEKGTFLAVCELVCDDAFTRGRQILSDLLDFYFEFEGSIPEKLNAAFKEAEAKLLEIDGVNLVLSAISGKALYLIARGQVEVYLKREDKLSSLLSVGRQAQLISGFLKEGDRLLFATKNLITFLGADLAKSLDLPIETFEEEISDRVGASDLENQGLAALALEVEADQEAAIENLEEKETAGIQKSSKISIVKNIGFNLVGFILKSGKYFPKGGRERLILAVVLIMILVAGLGFKYISSKNEQKQAQFQKILQEAQDDFNGAKGLTTLSPAEAKARLDAAKEKINKALNLDAKNKNALDLKQQIEEQSSSILQQVSVAQFPEFLDMDLVKKNFRAKSLSLSAGKLLLLDPAVKTLGLVDTAKKSNQILAGESQLGDGLFASLNGEMAFVYSQDKGLLRIDSTNQKVTTVSQNDEGWGDILDMYGFAGNIYLLDSLKNQIWKYLPTAEGYSDKREYLTKDTKVDLANALRMQIESSVYILKQGGEILRFTRGAKDNFGLEGLPSGVKDPKSFFVSSDTDNLYVLDSGNSRLLILTKIGAYKGQMAGEKFGSASDLVVDEKGKKVYLLEGSKIFQVDLK
ncbi:hypothetical protein HYZ05_01060 [Candidatus Daviesbacteria bacterium]|nr:hypothetical protein [Candidatus Daviesbacteria bacterium]